MTFLFKLDKAESYEERRVIRGQIRNAKRNSVISITSTRSCSHSSQSSVDNRTRTNSRIESTIDQKSKITSTNNDTRASLKSNKSKSSRSPSPKKESPQRDSSGE